MFGLSKNVTLALVGWLWADILLGLFVIFLAVSSTPVVDAQVEPGIDPTPLEIQVAVDGKILLAADGSGIERDRFVAEVERQLERLATGRKVAIVFAFGSHESPVEGDKLARSAIDGLSGVRFAGAVMKSYHDIVAGDPGSSVALEIYFHR